MTASTPERHVPVDGFTRRIANPLLGIAVRSGWGVHGARILTIAGRRSGRPRHSIVIPVDVDGHRFLVAPRGATDWVRNLRSAGAGALRVGRHREAVSAVELDDSDKAAVLRRYLERNRALVADILGDLDRTSSDADLLAAGAGIPVFRLA